MAVYEIAVGCGVLFGEYLDTVEERAQTGTLELVSLLDGVALGDEDESMALFEFVKRYVDAG